MNQIHDNHPPRWPLRLLRLLLRKKYLEEIEGDMEEIFLDNLDRFSVRKARLLYTWEMLRLLKPVLMQNFEGVEKLNQFGMFKNYFKVSVRGLMKNPVNSFINIFGLAVAIGVSMFAYAFARWTYNTDQFHVHKHEVHLVTFFANRDGTDQQFGQTPRPLGEMLKEDFAAVQKVCRVEDRDVVMKYKDNVFHEKVRFADPEFLEMLTFPMKWGTGSSLRDLNSIVLSAKMSAKYFGEENPIGRDILIRFDEAKSKAFKVTGVAKPFPDAHTIEFNFLLNYENVRVADPLYDLHDWSAFVNATLIQVADQEGLRAVANGMEKYKLTQNEAVEEDWAISSFGFEPLATLHERSSNIRGDISMSTDAKYQSIVFIIILGLFILALACFSYINIAIVSAARRLKEIGVRKTIGATRRIVIVQFLTENIVVTGFALLLGIILGTFVFIPWIENLNNFSLDFTLLDANLWFYLPAVMLVTGIASGSYPAFYISRFQVAGILKGSIEFGRRNPLTKVFLGFQLVLACILITTGVMFTQNNNYMSRRSWGYDQASALFVGLPDPAAYEKLHALVARNANVKSVSGSQHHLGKTHTPVVIRMSNRQFEVDGLSVDAGYFETMGLQLVTGRVFRENYESDKTTVVVNETLAQSLNLPNAVGTAFRIDSVQYEIIGVVRDFHSYSFFNKVRPTMFRLADKESYRYLSTAVLPGTQIETLRALQLHWSSLYPDLPFDGGLQEDTWGNYFEQISIHSRVWRGFATVAIVLAALGLYGLITLNVAGRVKEFSIRKVLGASIAHLTANITSQYIVLIAVSFSLGAPASYILNKTLFDAIYNYYMPITYSGVVIGMAILLMVFMITVSSQIRKVSRANPVDGLKVE